MNGNSAGPLPTDVRAGCGDVQRGPMEALMLQLCQLDAKVIALASPTADETVALISRALCSNLAAADTTVVMLELDCPEKIADDQPRWDPSTELDSGMIVRDRAGFDRVAGMPSLRLRSMFNNLRHVRRVLSQDLGHYGFVVLRLAPLLDPGSHSPNPLALARAADAVLLVCGSGRTTCREATDAVAGLRAAGAKVVGTILDDSQNALPGREIARAIERSRFLPAGLAQRLGRGLRASSLLNP